MTIDIEIYERPELVSKVKPMLVLEALPKSFATAHPAWGSEHSDKDPSNIFGYVIGPRKKSSMKNIVPVNHITNVERLLPIYSKDYGERINTVGLTTFNSSSDTYLCIGELLTGEPREINSASERAIGQGYERGSLIFNDEDLDEVRGKLFDFASNRSNKEYIFKSPTGQEYSLSEILLSLKEKK